MSAGTQSYQLSDYLEKLPGTTFKKLYLQPSTAFAIYRRMLPLLARVFVNSLLYMPDPFPRENFDLWVRNDARHEKERALAVMRTMHIILPPKPGDKTVQLSTNFRNSMRQVLEGNGNHNSFGIPSDLPVDKTCDILYLDDYARRKWDDILHYVVHSVGSGSGDHSAGGPKTSVKELLLAGHLVERRSDTRTGLGITQAGFTFLLQEANAQVWTLLLLWLEAADRIKLTASAKGDTVGMDSVDMLSFLFMLGTLELGCAYDTNALTESRRNMLPSLVDFGLIYIPKEEPRQYFPTRLATSLSSGSSALRSVSAGFAAALSNKPGDVSSTLGGGLDSGHGKGSIIIETNHRVYIYTTSPLQIAVLNLFIALDTRFQSMVTGKLTRESIRKAIRHGITADQIISYLQAHAHEQMHRMAMTSGKPLLPPTVVDQIRLWQLENERMKTAPGFLFKEMDVQEYKECVKHAEEIGVMLWKNDEKKMFFASKTEPIRDFLKSRQPKK